MFISHLGTGKTNTSNSRRSQSPPTCGQSFAPQPPKDTFISSMSEEDQTQSRFLAASLAKAAGSGTREDALIVARELAKVPPSYLRQLRDNGVQVLVGRENITDVAPEYANMQPRGWEKGTTFKDVTGIYDPKRNAVILSTTGHGEEGGPRLAQTHGSDNVVIHEVFHAIEHINPQTFGKNAPFSKAYQADLSQLSDYERQPGEAGMSEGFSESAAKFFNGTPQSESLGAYWQQKGAGDYEGRIETLIKNLNRGEESQVSRYLSSRTF